MLVKSGELPQQTKLLDATVCWMDNKALLPGNKYVLQHNTNGILAKIDRIEGHVETNFGGVTHTDSLKLNEIGKVSIKLSKPIFADNFEKNKANGRFILVDTQTNTTAGVGFIR